MNKFKVGDKVVKVLTQTSVFPIGCVKTISKIFNQGRSLEFEGGPYSSDASNWEAAWTPKQGEMIEVYSDAMHGWTKRPFFAFDGELAVCKLGASYYSHEKYKQIKPAYTITIDDKVIEVSEESFKALKASLCQETV